MSLTPPTSTPSAPSAPSEFIAPAWRERLDEQRLTTFDQFWKVTGEQVDPTNVARGGWSQVIRCALFSDPTVVLYVKKQLGYQSKTWRHPVRGIPTLQREFSNLEHCRRCGVPTASVVYFSTGTIDGQPAAILVTEALMDYEALHVRFDALPVHDQASRRSLLVAVAQALGRLHRSGLKHGCLYPKHILVPMGSANIDQLRFIDLEKARRFVFRRSAIRRDFGTLFRRMPGWAAEERKRFLEAYESVF